MVVSAQCSFYLLSIYKWRWSFIVEFQWAILDDPKPNLKCYRFVFITMQIINLLEFSCAKYAPFSQTIQVIDDLLLVLWKIQHNVRNYVSHNALHSTWPFIWQMNWKQYQMQSLSWLIFLLERKLLLITDKNVAISICNI